MEYTTPELTALTPAINAVQETGKHLKEPVDGQDINDTPTSGAYQDWE